LKHPSQELLADERTFPDAQQVSAVSTKRRTVDSSRGVDGQKSCQWGY